jgi:GYD domain
MKQFYMVMGDFDFVGICEAPDDAVMARYVLQLGGLGFVRTKTLKAFPETAYREIIRSLGRTLKPLEAECSTRRFRSDLRSVRAHRGRPLRASSVVGATDGCRNAVWALLLRALA